MKYLFLALIGILVFTSCKEKAEEKACTEEFRFLTLTVKDSLNKPVVLDSNYVEITATGEKFHVDNSGMISDSGVYALYSDSYINKLEENVNSTIKFIGIKNNATVVNQNYVVKQDGCHIELISGALEVSL